MTVPIFTILGVLIVLLIGFSRVYRNHSSVINKIDFANEYRNKFVEFTNRYFENKYDWSQPGEIDKDLYIWLTMNVSKIQNNLGSFGVMAYQPAFRNYVHKKYQIIINTIPKFRTGEIQSDEVNTVDDSLLRYIGHMDEVGKNTLKSLRNPIIWFRDGFREILSIPIYMLSWFGIISSKTLLSIKNSLIFKVISGFISLITFIGTVITIIVGYEKLIDFLNKIIWN